MAKISFTPNLNRHVVCPSDEFDGDTVREALERYFAEYSGVQHYVLDEHGAVRKHIVIFIDGTPIRDRQRLSDTISSDSHVFVFQALSGG